MWLSATKYVLVEHNQVPFLITTFVCELCINMSVIDYVWCEWINW